jgi:hypothetical protein
LYFSFPKTPFNFDKDKHLPVKGIARKQKFDSRLGILFLN